MHISHRCVNAFLVYLKNFREIEKIQTGRDKDTSLHLYRCIQILEKSMNPYTSDKILPAMLICCPSIQIIGQFVSINLHGSIPMPGFLVFPLMMVDTTIFNVLIVTFASLIFSSSQKTLQSLGKKLMERVNERGLTRRQLRSCSMLKIKFGSNFIDPGTPLVIQTFCINQTMSLSLINSNRRGW